MIYAGIDCGSRTIKAVLLDYDSKKPIASAVADQGVHQDRLTSELFGRLLTDSRIKRRDVRKIIATGCGRDIVSLAHTTVTEITCHAAGVRHLVPDAKTVIDIGGQDSKVIRLDQTGRVRDFAMNDRCAAGTGRFLEVLAERLRVELDKLGDVASKSSKPAVISSMCVVFAETELIGLLVSGTAREDIVAGVQAAIASRVTSLLGREVDSPVIFTGGVALVSGMASALASALGCNVTVSPDPQMTGALGAAILAADGVY